MAKPAAAPPGAVAGAAAGRGDPGCPRSSSRYRGRAAAVKAGAGRSAADARPADSRPARWELGWPRSGVRSHQRRGHRRPRPTPLARRSGLRPLRPQSRAARDAAAARTRWGSFALHRTPRLASRRRWCGGRPHRGRETWSQRAGGASHPSRSGRGSWSRRLFGCCVRRPSLSVVEVKRRPFKRGPTSGSAGRANASEALRAAAITLSGLGRLPGCSSVAPRLPSCYAAGEREAIAGMVAWCGPPSWPYARGSGPTLGRVAKRPGRREVSRPGALAHWPAAASPLCGAAPG